MKILIELATNKKVDLFLCAFLCFIAPCVGAVGIAMTSTVHLRGQPTPIVITTFKSPNETPHEHMVRHKNIIDRLKAATPPPPTPPEEAKGRGGKTPFFNRRT